MCEYVMLAAVLLETLQGTRLRLAVELHDRLRWWSLVVCPNMKGKERKGKERIAVLTV